MRRSEEEERSDDGLLNPYTILDSILFYLSYLVLSFNLILSLFIYTLIS
nr:MAG TPA: hypothetical protein [Caudoviricetes sp.]